MRRPLWAFFLSGAPALCALACLSVASAQTPPDPQPRASETADSLAAYDRVEVLDADQRTGAHECTCTGRVVDPDGKPVAGCRIALVDYVPYYWALPLSRTETDADGRFALEVESAGGNTAVVVSRAGYTPAWRSVSLVSGRETTVEAIAVAPIDDAPDPVVVRGTVLDGAAGPVEGALLRAVTSTDGHLDMTAFATSGPDGRFEFEQAYGDRSVLQVLFANRILTVYHKAGTEELSGDGRRHELDLEQDDLTIQHETFETFTVRPADADSELATAFRLERLWIPTTSGRVTAVRSEHGDPSVTVRMSRPGRAGRVASISGDRTDTVGGGVEFALRVVNTRGTPVPWAVVHLCNRGTTLDEWTRDRMQTDAEGLLLFATDPGDESFVAYVYADGYRPARCSLTPGVGVDDAVECVLTPIDATLTCTLPATAKSLFVRRAGTFDPAFLSYFLDLPTPSDGTASSNDTTRSLEIPLAAGRYELTAYGPDGVLAMDAVDITASQRLAFSLSADRRPVVVLTLPPLPREEDNGWWAFASRNPAFGMVQKWMAYSGGGRGRHRRTLDTEVTPLVDPDTGADSGTGPGTEAGEREREDTSAPTPDAPATTADAPQPADTPPVERFRLVFPTSGDYVIYSGHPTVDHRYFAPITLELGSQLDLTLPTLDASLTGSMPEFPSVWEGGAQHGIAGPRLMLTPDPRGSTRFGVHVGLPEPATFTITNLPPGRFVLSHHLYETGFYTSDSGHYGGRTVELDAARATDVAELGRGGIEREVEIVGADGKPLSGRLALRDPMFDSWNEVLRDGSTLSTALDAIPTPPVVDLENGHASIPRLRPGLVCAELVTTVGVRVEFWREVPKKGVVRWQVDLGTGGGR